MVEVNLNHRFNKLHFSMHFDLQLVNGRLVDARLTAPAFTFCDWLSVRPKYLLMRRTLLAMTLPPKPATIANDASWTS